MNTENYAKYFYYTVSLIFLITGLLGINRLITKADLPFSYYCNDDKIISAEQYESIIPGDVIQTVNSISIKSLYQLETILDSRSVGLESDLNILSAENKVSNLHVHLIRYYRKYNFILISLLAGLSFWITSVFLIRKKSGDRAVRVLFWVFVLFSLATMTSPGKYFTDNDWVAYLVRASHVSSYFLGGIAFLQFTFLFPAIRIKRFDRYFTVLYILSSLFCISLISVQIYSVNNINSEMVLTMETLWKITEAVLLISVISGAVNLFMFYRKMSDAAEKKKAEWIFWGLAAGAFPFLLLWLLPRLLGFDELIQEEFLLAFLIFVPVFFTRAIIKYHIFDIDVFIKKSILYTALTFTIIIIYLAANEILRFIASDFIKGYEEIVSVLLIFFAIIIFNPIQNKLRNYIDKIFYREGYDFEKAVINFSAGLNDQITIYGLSKYAVTEIQKIIPARKIAFAAEADNRKYLKILSQNNFAALSSEISDLILSVKNTGKKKVFTAKDKTEPGLDTDNSKSDMLTDGNICVIIPFNIEPENISAAIILGDKISGRRYMKEDIELLNILFSNVMLAFKKLQLQEKVELEELEISRLEEFNKNMIYYVSRVSHDLKTPLTSIKMFSEILKEQDNFKTGNSNEYLEIIEGETDRLTRLINNVLNYSKIVNGIKEYSFVRVNLNECIRESLKIMEYQFMMENFRADIVLQDNIFIKADKDAVKEALINILSNAIKYSPEKKFIRVTSEISENYAVVKIKDEGIGISKKDIENIFNPFVRLKNSKIKHTGGAGIGLSIIKNIMDSHKGRTEVVSELGKGTSFILYFPLCTAERQVSDKLNKF
ncbi:MAG TPA: HAMP domain-containing sensor histidine kinase [Ignavibacteria bacterium]|nr:hypothetical protein [Bacteroidota bacterium]HRI86233.1 HAMP domain-containing sensor histidine kinase [Ignavibacteria bacterium]HRJ99920.1 HAMP domain-containing sensor histidine kinase [Ignavibacteria bacterium]